jgi:hypothetical protein
MVNRGPLRAPRTHAVLSEKAAIPTVGGARLPSIEAAPGSGCQA